MSDGDLVFIIALGFVSLLVLDIGIEWVMRRRRAEMKMSRLRLRKEINRKY